MDEMLLPYAVGLLLGVPLAIKYPRFRDRPIPWRFGMGVVVGFGIAITINGSLELLGLLQWRMQTRQADVEPAEIPPRRSDIAPGQVHSQGENLVTFEQSQHYSDGTLKATRVVYRDVSGNDIPHGPAATYYPNGKMKWSGNYENGNQVGEWQEFYPDGSKEGEGSIFADGRAEETHWYQNGTRKSEGTWRDGVKHGRWKTWHASGQLAGEYRYDSGMLQGAVKEWHANATIKLDAVASDGDLEIPIQQ